MIRRILGFVLSLTIVAAALSIAYEPATQASGSLEQKLKDAYAAYSAQLNNAVNTSRIAPTPNPYDVDHEAALQAWMDGGGSLGVFYAELVYLGDSEIPLLLYAVDSGAGPNRYVCNIHVFGFSSGLEEYGNRYGYSFYTGGDNPLGSVAIVTDNGGTNYLLHYERSYDFFENDYGGFDSIDVETRLFYAIKNNQWVDVPMTAYEVATSRYIERYAPETVRDVLTELKWLQLNPWEPLGNFPADWAITEVSAAVAANLVPHSISGNGWQNATTRLDAADAIVMLIEKASGKTMEEIASERGWNLNINQFSDTISHSVTFLKYAEVTTGVGNNRYDPHGFYDRAQIVTMIGRTAETFFGKAVQGSNPFTDVPTWAAPYVGYAAANNITQGVGGNRFDPDGVLENQHTAVFCYRAFNAW